MSLSDVASPIRALERVSCDMNTGITVLESMNASPSW